MPSNSASLPPRDNAVLITGAAKRLGREIALAMAKAGWDVVLHARESMEGAHAVMRDVQSMGRKAICIAADLDDAASIHTLFQRAVEAFPNLCAVVNSASQFLFDRPHDVTAKALESHYRCNLIAPVLLTQHLHAHCAQTVQAGSPPAGVVIHLLDQKLANPNPDFFAYTLSKSALLEATRLTAMAFAPVLRVVGVAPGITLPSADQTPDEFKTTHAMTPLGASSYPHEVADAVVWLAQARAITGTWLLVDGGQHLMAQPRDVMMMIRPPC